MTPAQHKNLNPKQALLLRAIRTMNQYNNKDALYPGQMDALLLAMQTVAYITEVPVNYVIHNTRNYKGETHDKEI